MIFIKSIFFEEKVKESKIMMFHSRFWQRIWKSDTLKNVHNQRLDVIHCRWHILNSWLRHNPPNIVHILSVTDFIGKWLWMHNSTAEISGVLINISLVGLHPLFLKPWVQDICFARNKEFRRKCNSKYGNSRPWQVVVLNCHCYKLTLDVSLQKEVNWHHCNRNRHYHLLLYCTAMQSCPKIN